ncbi:MAG: prepilin-type N-terminal cleavage/methylation domain-containing protein, partial [Deltaproteobacteria bacterium]|nr:prepilin-type N-terminal cleavage/methylation domain-containing protein [Deltaproteobacteria bacterium]
MKKDLKTHMEGFTLMELMIGIAIVGIFHLSLSRRDNPNRYFLASLETKKAPADFCPRGAFPEIVPTALNGIIF